MYGLKDMGPLVQTSRSAKDSGLLDHEVHKVPFGTSRCGGPLRDMSESVGYQSEVGSLPRLLLIYEPEYFPGVVHRIPFQGVLPQT